MKTAGECVMCAEPIAQLAGRGRAKRYCSNRCRQSGHRLRVKVGGHLPVELIDRPRWVRHYRKRPITAQGMAATSTNPLTWSTYRDAAESPAGDGLGFVLGDGIGCIDLDDVLDAAGNLDPAAQQLIDSLPETFVEVSMSGRGLHVFGFLPEGRGRRRQIDGVKVETYSKSRYIAVTGRRWADTPVRLGDITGALAW